MQNKVEQALADLSAAQQEAREQAILNHAAAHQDLAAEMAEQLEKLSRVRQEMHAAATAGRVGPPVEALLDREQVEERRKRIMRAGGFRV